MFLADACAFTGRRKAAKVDRRLLRLRSRHSKAAGGSAPESAEHQAADLQSSKKLT